MQTIKLRFIGDRRAFLEQGEGPSKIQIPLTLHELHGVIDFLKSPSDAPLLLYSKHEEPLSVQFDNENQCYEIKRGNSVLLGDRRQHGSEEELRTIGEGQADRSTLCAFIAMVSRLASQDS